MTLMAFQIRQEKAARASKLAKNEVKAVELGLKTLDVELKKPLGVLTKWFGC